MPHELVAMPSFAFVRNELILRLERMAMQLVPRRKQPTQLRAALIGPFDMTRSKLLFLTSVGVSFALVVIAAGSLLGNPDTASTRAIASMGPHALATIVLRVPQ